MLEEIPEVAYIVFAFPVKMFPIFDTAVVECQEVMQDHEDKALMTKKINCHVRIFGFNFQNSDGITQYLIFIIFTFHEGKARMERK